MNIIRQLWDIVMHFVGSLALTAGIGAGYLYYTGHIKVVQIATQAWMVAIQ